MEKTEVRLTGPAKVGGVWKKPGDVVSLDDAELAQVRDIGLLSDTGLIATSDPVELITTDGTLTGSVEAERDAALARAIEVEAQRDLLQDRVTQLQGQLAAAQAVQSQPVTIQAEAKPPTHSEPSPDPEKTGDTPAAPAPDEKAAKPGRSRGGKKS